MELRLGEMKGTYDAIRVSVILLAAMGGTELWATGPATHLVQNHAPIVSPRRVAFIPSKADRKQPVPCDFNMYKWRHLAETFFYDLKRFRRVAARYEKTHESFRAMILCRKLRCARARRRAAPCRGHES